MPLLKVKTYKKFKIRLVFVTIYLDSYYLSTAVGTLVYFVNVSIPRHFMQTYLACQVYYLSISLFTFFMWAVLCGPPLFPSKIYIFNFTYFYMLQYYLRWRHHLKLNFQIPSFFSPLLFHFNESYALPMH